MARHDLVAHLFPEGVFFAYPCCPWQRGTSENSNGLLRQYLPRSADLSLSTDEDLRRIETLLNTRPRKTLGGRLPPPSSPASCHDDQHVLRRSAESAVERKVVH